VTDVNYLARFLITFFSTFHLKIFQENFLFRLRKIVNLDSVTIRYGFSRPKVEYFATKCLQVPSSCSYSEFSRIGSQTSCRGSGEEKFSKIAVTRHRVNHFQIVFVRIPRRKQVLAFHLPLQ
jgi:hypothetical protein